MYKAIMSAIAVSPKPSMEPNKPTADITAPPGTPGAASMTTPSISINGKIVKNDGIASELCRNITAMVQLTMVMVEPAKCTVAHSGTAKLATSSLTLFSLTLRKVTGMVAALDMVPNAVK